MFGNISPSRLLSSWRLRRQEQRRKAALARVSGKITPQRSVLETIVYSSLRLATPERARRLLETMCRYPQFVPDRYGIEEPIRLRFEVDDLSGPVEALVDRESNELQPLDAHGHLLLERRKRPACDYNVNWSGARLHPITLSFYSVDKQYLNEPNNLRRWLDFTFELIDVQEAWFGAVALGEEFDWKHWLVYTMPANAPRRASRGAQVQAAVGTKLYENIPGVYWGNYFGPFYVEWLGRDRFASLPCIEKRDLPNGGIFFTTAPRPEEWNTPAAQSLQKQVRQHLDADAFFDMDELRADFAMRLGRDSVFDPDQIIHPRRIPDFPFAETYRTRLAEVAVQHRDDVIREQAKMGMQFVEETTPGVLLFRDKTGSRVVVDMEKREMHVFVD